jgi:hypothetical protein
MSRKNGRRRRCCLDALSGDTMDVLNFEGEPIRDDTFVID